MEKKILTVLFTASLAGVVGVTYVTPEVFSHSRLASAAASFLRGDSPQTVQDITEPELSPPPPRIEHLETPQGVRAVYMSQCAAGSASLRGSLLSLADETEINAIVVDLKDYTGTVVFKSDVAISGGGGCTVSDFRELVKEMHRRNIYVIGRLTVFQDPLYTKTYPEQAVKKASDGNTWHDYKGLSFVDVGATPFWKYIVHIAREAHALGVDEINFDYIRYPSDGPMYDIAYTHSSGSKQENLERFFLYLSREMRTPPLDDARGKPFDDAQGKQTWPLHENDHLPVLSADLFGMTTTNTDDLNIGQVLERALPYFDYIAPMVYPSHYPSGLNGWANPNNHVYGVVEFSMKRAVERVGATTTPTAWFGAERIGTTTSAIYTKKVYSRNMLRPWLQDFDYGGNYDVKEVRAQIQAAYDVGLDSWMLWSPSNKYTKSALELASTTGQVR